MLALGKDKYFLPNDLFGPNLTFFFVPRLSKLVCRLFYVPFFECNKYLPFELFGTYGSHDRFLFPVGLNPTPRIRFPVQLMVIINSILTLCIFCYIKVMFLFLQTFLAIF